MTIHTAPVTAPSGHGLKSRPRSWMVAVVVFWVVLLGAGIGWALARGGPTAREQTTVADALPVVDRVVAEIVGAVDADGQAVPAITGPDRVDGCQISVVRKGIRLRRAVTVAVMPGTEAALLQRIGARLPASYGVKVTGSAAPKLVGDAGFWVQVTAAATGKGLVQFVADTGSCRPAGDLPTAPTDASGVSDRAEVETALAKLGLSADQWHAYRSSCPNGGEIRTVEAVSSPGLEPGSFTELLAGVGHEVVTSPDVYAYTSGDRRVAVYFDNAGVVVSATTAC